MRLASTAAAVLAWAGTANADMGVPGAARRVPVRVTITADPPPAGVAVVVVPDHPRRLSPADPRRLSAETPVVLDSKDGGVTFTVYAVDPWAPGEFKYEVPPREWFSPAHAARFRVLGGERVGDRLGFFDGRSEVVEEYRVERHGGGLQLRKVSDNVPGWWQSGSCSLAVLSALIALIWLGVRLARSRPVRPSEGGA